jgi:hypothetical protein
MHRMRSARVVDVHCLPVQICLFLKINRGIRFAIVVLVFQQCTSCQGPHRGGRLLDFEYRAPVILTAREPVEIIFNFQNCNRNILY